MSAPGSLSGDAEAASRLAVALRTGLPSAVAAAIDRCAADVSLTCVNGTFVGAPAVARRLSGEWPLLPVLARGVWSEPTAEGEWHVIGASFPGLGASPTEYTLRVRCRHGLVVEAVETYRPMSVITGSTIPDDIVAVVNRALRDAKPVTVSYVDPDGHPTVSLRGSFQISSERVAWLWSRSSSGGLVEALSTRPHVAALYRDSATRTTLRFRGRGRVVTEPDQRTAIFAATPEVEQRHDPEMSGAAVMIDLDSVTGTSPLGSIRIGD